MMSKFLANIGAGLRAPGFGDRLQAALAAAGGDTAAIQRLRALQLQQAQLQRQDNARDAQVIGAKNMGFGNDEIGAMNPEDLSWAARQRVASSGHGQPPFADDGGGAALDRTAVFEHAAAAIQRGADPNVVRARLQQMGHTDLDPPNPFSDLIPDGRQALGLTRNPGFAVQAEPQLTPQGQGGLVGNLHPAPDPRDYRNNPQRRSAPMMAPPKAEGPAKYFQPRSADPITGRASEIGRAIVSTINRPPRSNNSPSLTPWMRRRRAENEALLNDPRIRAFLDMTSFSEGNTHYDTRFGIHGRTFTDRSTHPGAHGENYRGRAQSAAGRYQIQGPTYEDLNNRLGSYTMSDRDQDLMAIEIIREGPALEPLMAGNVDEAISRLGRRRFWTSFPVLHNGAWRPNPSGQHTQNIEDLRARYHEALVRAQREGLEAAGNRLTRN
jgi:muramidase (phage lysozyme)